MADAAQYAQWLVNNADKKGTPEFNTVASAYRALRQQAAPAAPKSPEPVEAPPERTLGGNVKEFFKGIPSGAVGLLESAAIGASAALPDEYEAGARETIKDVASAAKAPFAADAGYEDSVPRQLGSAVGSTIPFLAAGPAGLAGRIGLTGLAAGAGAGEARTRAEEGGADSTQRAQATAAGTVVGLAELIAPLRLMGRMPPAVKEGGVAAVKRALISGGEEAAQEAASSFAQNLIAKGIYKPDQALIEGVGEQAAYGGATGAIVDGILGLVLGRRARIQGEASEAQKARDELEQRILDEQAPAAEPLRLGGEGAFVPRALPDGSVAMTAQELADYEQAQFDAQFAPQRDEVAPEVAPEVAQTAEPETAVEPEPAAEPAPSEDVVTMDVLQGIGVPMRTSKSWFTKNIVGKTVDQVQELVVANPKLVQGKGDRAKVLREILTPPAATYVEPEVATPMGEPTTPAPTTPAPTTPELTTPAPTTPEPVEALPEVPVDVQAEATPDVRLEPALERPAVEPSVGVSESAGLSDADAAGVEPSDALGVAPSGRAPRERAISAGDTPTAVIAQLEQANTRPKFEAAMDNLVRVQRDLAHPEQDAVSNIIENNLSVPEFERALVAAERRVRDQEIMAMSEPAAPKAAAAKAPARGKFPQLPPKRFPQPTPKGAKTSQAQGTSQTGPDLSAAIANGVDSTLDAIVQQAPSPAYKEIARAIAKRIKQLEALGFTFSVATTKEGYTLRGGSVGQATTRALPLGESTQVDVVLNHPSNGERSGTTWETTTHEFAHAATQAVIKFAPDGSAAKKLTSLYNDVVREFNRRASAGNLTPFEQAVFNRENNALADPDEMLAWGLTNVEAQQWLASVKVGRRSLFTRLVDVVADALGIRKGEVTALSEVIALSDEILSTDLAPYVEQANRIGASFGMQENTTPYPSWALRAANGQKILYSAPDAILYEHPLRSGAMGIIAATPKFGAQSDIKSAPEDLGLSPARMAELRAIADTFRAKTSPQISKQTEAIVESSEMMQPQQSWAKRALDTLAAVFEKNAGISVADKFRTLTVDAGASMESRLNTLFDGAVRSSKGIINPISLFRQAQDPAKLLTPWFKKGGLAKNADTGQYEAVEQAGVPSMQEVLSDIDAWAKSQGMSFEKAKGTVSKMLEALRLDGLRKSNENEGTKFAIQKLSNADKSSADAQIDAALKDYKATPEVQAIKAKLDKMRVALVDQMVSTGRLSQEMGDAWKAVSDYVPFDRVEDLDTKFRPAKKMGGRGGVSQLRGLPELVTSKTREVGDTIDNFTKTAGWMLDQIVRQDATKSTVRMLEKLGYAEYKGKNSKNVDPAKQVLVYVKGEANYFELPSRWDALAFSQMTMPKGAFVDFFSGFSNVLRKTITSMPPFAVKQVVDDIQRAFVTSGVERPSMLILPSLRNFVSIAAFELVGKVHPSVRDFGDKGIVGDYDFNLRNPMDSILYDLGFKARGPVRGLLHRLEGITRASDLAVRKAVYDRTMAESQNELLATTRARELINFRRQGSASVMPALSATIPFFNAYLQGMDVLYRAATGKSASAGLDRQAAKRLFMSKIATMAAFSTVYALLMSGDDDYEETTLRVRNSNWILPGGVKLSVPTELGAIYKVPTEMALEYFRRSGTPEDMEAAEASITALKFALEQYVGRTVPIPAAVKPVLEAFTNHSFFTGEQLEGTYQQDLLPSQRVRGNTSELAKAIAQFTSSTFGESATLSPIKIDNFLQGYFGSVAGIMAMGTDQLLNPSRMDRPMNKYWMLSNFTYDPVGTRKLDEFYDTRAKVVPVLNTLNKLMKEDPERAVKFAEDNQQELILAQAINSTLRQLSDLRQYKKYLNSDISAQDLSQEERSTQMEEIRRQEVEVVSWLREAKAELRNQ